MKLLIQILNLCFFLSNFCHSSEILSDSIFRSTGYKCVGEFTRLECESDKMIIVTRVLSRRSTLNFNCSVFDGDNDDISEFDYDFKDKCNGGTTCQFKLPQGKHLFGQYKSTANFESNRINIIYSCVPKMIETNIKKFDICSSSKIPREVTEGFIHTPDFPEYYGNHRDCSFDLNVPNENYRLFAYLISVNVESLGWFSNVPKDYLHVQNIEKFFYGKQKSQLILMENKPTRFRFVSDHVTTSSLDKPKGVLIYFKIVKIPPKSTTPNTVTTSTTKIISIQITTQSIVTAPPESTTEDLKVEMMRMPELNDAIISAIVSPTKHEDRSSLLICIIVGLCGLCTVLLVTVLLLLRRRASNAPNDGGDSNYSMIEKIKGLYGRSDIFVIKQEKENKLNETKTEIVDQNEKNDEDLSKCENIYVRNPFVEDKKRNDEEIYETINESDQSSSSNEIEDTNEKKKRETNEVVLLTIDHQLIYSTPTNKALTSDERKLFLEQNNNNPHLLS